jgi:iron complex transport system ATP-binding protein
MLELVEVSCGYGKKTVLEGLSFSVGRGEIVSILGANGIGKTTLFKSILGHIGLLSGQIMIDGRDISRMNHAERAKRIAYVPQAHIPPFPFQVKDVVVMGRTAHIKAFSKPSRTDFEIAAKALSLVNMFDLKDKVYTEISGGERQLVLIARAIAQEADTLIMDEPLANLDFGNQSRTLSQLRRLSELGFSVIYTTHNPEHAFQCSDKVLAIKGKGKYELGRAEEVITGRLLQEIYHIQTEIREVSLSSRKVRVCIPDD